LPLLALTRSSRTSSTVFVIDQQATELLDAGLAPDSAEAQALAAEMWFIIEKYTHGQPEMMQRLYVFFQGAKEWSHQYAKMQKTTDKFLESSLEQYIKGRSAVTLGYNL